MKFVGISRHFSQTNAKNTSNLAEMLPNLTHVSRTFRNFRNHSFSRYNNAFASLGGLLRGRHRPGRALGAAPRPGAHQVRPLHVPEPRPGRRLGLAAAAGYGETARVSRAAAAICPGVYVYSSSKLQRFFSNF